MIASLNGKLLRKSPISIVIDVQGVGYLVQVSLPTFYGLPEIGAQVSMRIYTVVREDEIRLFGFSSELEQVVFEKLIAISKVGPKLAISILSGMSVEDFLGAIGNKDIAKLNGIPGVGAKTAERLALELHDKLKGLTPETEVDQAPVGDVAFDDALSALLNLGYKMPQAEKALKSVHSEENKNDLEDLIKRALTVLS
jgi:holliday junction DNA helicase RuvA